MFTLSDANLLTSFKSNTQKLRSSIGDFLNIPFDAEVESKSLSIGVLERWCCSLPCNAKLGWLGCNSGTKFWNDCMKKVE